MQKSILLETLVGTSLRVNELIEILYNNIFETRDKPDTFERALQLNFIDRLKELKKDEKLNPEIKALLEMVQRDINKWAKKKRNNSNKNLQAHFRYSFKQSSEN